VAACGDLDLVKSMVLSGAGISVLPWRVAIQGTVRGALRLIDFKLPFEVDVGGRSVVEDRQLERNDQAGVVSADRWLPGTGL
jgi:DNA-binding transcriptional LysR family regulator